jgi:hypothetical protein
MSLTYLGKAKLHICNKNMNWKLYELIGFAIISVGPYA